MGETLGGITITLHDGTPVLVRPVCPDDAEPLKRGVREMSETSRYMRFFSTASGITDEQAAHFTNVDQINHVAWCGIEPTKRRRGYGLARFVRETPRAIVANFAVAVIDEMQGRGLGTALLAAIYLRAREIGVRELQGEMLPENPIMPKLMPKIGGMIVWTGDPSCRLIRWPVRGSDELPTDTKTGRRFIAWLNELSPVVAAHVPTSHGTGS